MANSVFTDIGPMPELHKWDLVKFRIRLLNNRLAILGDAAKSRTTTYYVSTSGSDSNDGLSTGAPFATLSKVHDVLAASSGDVRFRFKNGDTWVGKGKDFVWMATDGGHNAGVYCNKDNVTFDTYGDGNPPIFRVSAGLGATWTVNTNSYYADVSSFGRIDEIYETDGSTTRFSRQTSLASCESNERSFFYDSATDRIYVHYDGAAEPPSDLFAVEQNNVSCFRLEGDDNILDMNGAEFYGFGYDLDDTNSHDYAVATGVSGTKMITVANAKAYYGSAHLFANWWAGATSESGGFGNFINLSGGYGSSLFDRVVNCYQPGGEAEFYCYNIQSDRNEVVSVNGHSGGTENDFLWCDSCGGLGVNSSNISVLNAINFGGIFGTPSDRIAGLVSFTLSIINCAYFIEAGSTGTANLAATGKIYNTIIDFKHTGTADSFIASALFLGSVSAAAITADFLHCLLRFGNTVGGSRRGVGLSYNTMQNNDQPTGATANRCLWLGYDRTSTYLTAPGIGDSNDRQIDCTYYAMAKTTSRNQAGWNNVTTGVELDSSPVFVDADSYIYIPNTDSQRLKPPSVEFDFFSNRRKSSTSTDGPVEREVQFSSGSGGGGTLTRVLGRSLGRVLGR